MNWDTNETLLWITNDEYYYNLLKDKMGNEMAFIFVLATIIFNINVRIGNEEMRIDSANVNGNKVYINFCELAGNEQQGWCRNE